MVLDPNAKNIVSGVVRGKTVELDQPTNIPDGERVTLQIVREGTGIRRPPGGMLRAFGGWSEDHEELQQYIKEVREQRHSPHREIKS